MRVTNRLLLRVFGLRRSGNHAVIGWMMENTPGTKLHLNNIGDHLANPYRAFASAVISGPQLGQVFRRRKLLRMLQLHGEKLTEKKFYNSTEEVNLKSLKGMPKDLLLLSYEDIDLRSPCIQEFLDAPDNHVGSSERILTALILRDPFNQFASLTKKGLLNQSTAEFYVDHWKQYAREFVGQTQFLGEGALKVNYNDWVQNESYRASLLQGLGITGDGSAYSKVPSFGNGSSFQPEAQSADQLSVFDRWKDFSRDVQFQRHFDQEILEYASAVFGEAFTSEIWREVSTN